MTFTNYPLKLCTFCYKSVSRTEDDRNQPNIEILTKFYKQLSSFVKNSSSSYEQPLVCCKDCELLIREFCEVHHQITCLELKLQWKLETLMKVMKLADKVFSRVKELEKSFADMETSTNINNDGQTMQMGSDQTYSAQEAYKLFKSLRNDIFSKCCRIRKTSQLQPRVVLKRLEDTNKRMTSVKMERCRDLTKQPSFSFDLGIGWLMSFGAVVFLQSLYSNYRNENRTDIHTILFDNDDSNGIIAEENFDVENNQTIGYTLPCQSNDLDDETGFCERSPSGLDEDIRLNIPQNLGNDDTCESSEDNSLEILALKQEPISKNDTNISLENRSTNITNQECFSCKICGFKSTNERLLSSHIKRQHEVLKRNPNMSKRIFTCGVCKTSYKTYQVLRSHKVSALHRFLQKKLLKNNSAKMTNIKSEYILGALEKTPESTELDNQDGSIIKENNKVLQNFLTSQKEMHSTRFNLRRRNTQKSYSCTDDISTDINSDTDKVYLKEIDSKNTSSSEESDSDDDKSSSSSHSENENEAKIECGRESLRFYRCYLDDCKLKQQVFYKKISLDEHKNLHVRGEYQCNFCDKVEITPINLSLHETEMHSAIPSTSTNIKNYDSIIYCARCPFETQKEKVYLNHFASTHLGINGSETKKSLWECDICRKKFVRGKSRSEIHFKTHHDTSGLKNPDLDITRCNKNGCSAYFLTQSQLQIHKVLQHSQSKKDDQLQELINNMIETNDETGNYKCLLCMMESRILYSIQKHIRKFHYQTIKDRKENSSVVEIHNTQVRSGKHSNELNNSVKYPFMCFMDRCNRRFQTQEALDFHQNLHKRGEYSCKFCDTVEKSILKLSMHESLNHPYQNTENKEDGFYNCSRCSYKINSRARYHAHFAEKHIKSIVRPVQSKKLSGNFKCKFCDAKTRTAAQLGYHEAEHVNKNQKSETGELPKIQCPRCPKSYKKLYYIKHFLKVHFDGCTKSKQKICPICKEKNTSQTVHFQKYHDTKKSSNVYKCEGEDDKCTSYYIQYDQLLRHKKLRHPKTEWRCKECGKNYKTEKSFQIHQRIYHFNLLKNPDLQFLCETENCKRGFHSKGELEYHMKYGRCEAKANKPVTDKIKCTKCNEEFVSIAKLNTHEYNIHLIPSFICQECGKAFKIKAHLQNHLDYHKGPETWKFQCSTCGKKCVSKYTLTAHLRTHTGEKPYVCQYCGEKYAHLHNWKNHMLTKQGIRIT